MANAVEGQITRGVRMRAEVFVVSMDLNGVTYGPNGVEFTVKGIDSIIALTPLPPGIPLTGIIEDGYLHLYGSNQQEVGDGEDLSVLGTARFLAISV